MAQNDHNRKRAFADAVTIDAWHTEFGEQTARANLHVDVVFGTARVGGEPESPVRFRLSIKRAQIVVVIPKVEPLSVDRASVSRDGVDLRAHLTEVLQQSHEVSGKGSMLAALSTNRVAASVSGQAEVGASVSSNRRLEVSATVPIMTATQSLTADGHYRWVVEPSATDALKGRPWDATKEPRLRLIDTRTDRSKGIPPTVYVEVRCLREDLVIDELTIKDETLWEATKRRAGFRNRMAAAESYIRDRLLDEGLEVRNVSDIFGELTVGRVTAEPT